MAARILGITPSALSQSVRALEERLGIPLFVRSTRSVSLTDAGRRFHERLAPVLEETAAALDEARGSADVTQGTLRITVGRLTVPLVIEPVLRTLLDEHPKLSIEVSVEDRFVDIVANGLDAGIRLSESIQPDFTIVRLTPAFRLLVAGAPSYFKKHGKPKHPRDLVNHDCINYRMSSTGAFYAWEFERRHRGGKKNDKIVKEEQISVRGRVACNDGAMMLHAAREGLGLVYVHEQAIAPYVDRGELEVVLEDWAVSVPGFFLCFPKRSNVQPKLRAFIDVARRVLNADPINVALLQKARLKERRPPNKRR